MRICLFVFVLSITQNSLSQDFFDSRIEPMLKAHSQMEYVYGKIDITALNCPPKLTNNHFSTLSFIDSIEIPKNFENKMWKLFLENRCESLYQIIYTFKLFQPVYSNALINQGISEAFNILPLTVSGGNPLLRYNKDKAGVWQLSYVNARKYGLIVNQWIDQRNDIEKSSIAAARYLHFLNQYYLNNELLVVAAFYTSVPFVNKHLRSLKYPSQRAFIDALPDEIRGYFWYLKTWSKWLGNMDFSAQINQTDFEVEWSIVEIKDTLSFDLISQFMDIPITTLRLMNPVLIGETVFPDKTLQFYLPKKKAALFESKYTDFIAFQIAEKERKRKELTELKKRLEQGIPDLTKYKAVTYTVKQGDVLGKIALQNHVKVSQIKQWNHLHSDRIDIGQKLVLYVPKNLSTQLPPETADNKIVLGPKPPKPGKGNPISYTVKPGESLWLIAKKFPGISAQNIMEWNGCTEKINPGMVLKIYNPE